MQSEQRLVNYFRQNWSLKFLKNCLLGQIAPKIIKITFLKISSNVDIEYFLLPRCTHFYSGIGTNRGKRSNRGTLVTRISVQARISVQGGILLKILKKCRVKTGSFMNNMLYFLFECVKSSSSSVNFG